jgi:hypothetical protein
LIPKKAPTSVPTRVKAEVAIVATLSESSRTRAIARTARNRTTMRPRQMAVNPPITSMFCHQVGPLFRGIPPTISTGFGSAGDGGVDTMRSLLPYRRTVKAWLLGSKDPRYAH